jgi:hypothetical protein
MQAELFRWPTPATQHDITLKSERLPPVHIKLKNTQYKSFTFQIENA